VNKPSWKCSQRISGLFSLRAGSFILFVCCCLLREPSAHGAQSGDFTYTTSGTSATITGYTGPGGTVALPLNINGYRVAYVGGYAFYGVTSMTNLNVSSSVISIQPSALIGCTSLVAINVDPANANLSSQDGIMFSASKSVLLLCPAGRAGSYAVPIGVVSIASDAFLNCSQLTRVFVPSSVTTIGNQAFDYCTGLSAFYFLGNAPTVYPSGFASSTATVFYMPGTTGWQSTFAGRPTLLWNPVVQLDAPGFGPQPGGGFGVPVSGSSNLVVVLEVSQSLEPPGWFPLATNTLLNGSSQFIDPTYTNRPSSFYRLRSP